MSPARAATEPYDPALHDSSEFQSGNQALDTWLHRYAGQSERRNAARTFVLTDAGVVIGYYALLAGELDHGQATERTRIGMSRDYPIPVDAPAARFYEHFGFGALSATPRTLMVTLAELRAAGYP